MRRLNACLTASLLLPLLAPAAAPRGAARLRADEPPAREELRRQARRCRRILKTSLVDFYLPAAVDREEGGYFESLRDGKFAPAGEKFLTLQARQLWFFSTLAREGVERDAALGAARSGFDFLEKKMRDPRHGGYFSKVTDAGAPKDTRKDVYLNAFALYGLVAYHRAADDPAALAAAKDLFRVLEEKAHDRRNGGYDEFFTEDWRAVADPKEDDYVGTPGTKTYNTHLHVLEALTALYRVWPDPPVKDRLAELLEVNTNTVRCPDVPCNLDGWRPDWTMIEAPANLRASYGHDVECTWLALDAARALGRPPALYRGWAESLCGYSLKYGYDRRHGGFFYTGPLGKPAGDTRKEWWVQAEALVAMLEMYRLTGKPEYYDAFARTLDFVEEHQEAREGGWWATRAADGSAQGDQRSSPWQGAYHDGRAMLLCANLLEELADKPAADDGTKGPDKELDGEWEAVTFIHEGKDEPQPPGKVLLTIHGDAMTLKVGDEVRRATVTADAAKKPRAIDMAYETGPDKGKTIRGVYEVTGDELRICHGDATKERPSEIASREGGGYSIGVWKRVKK